MLGADGRAVSTPLWWYPRLAAASPAERANYEIIPIGIHWPDLDEDLSVAGMLAGREARPAPARRAKRGRAVGGAGG